MLCRLRDVQDYRIHSGSTCESVTGGSAFNISAASLRLGDFDRAEVESLLGQHSSETGQGFEPEALERVPRVIEPLLSGEPEHGFSVRDHEYVRDLGLVAPGDEIRVANPIYAEVIPRELTFITQKSLRQRVAWYLNPAGSSDSGKLMAAFQQYFREHVESWLERFAYKEAGPPLLLQAFFQRIASGEGRIVREYGLGRQGVDRLILWSRPQGIHGIVIECKIRRSTLERTIAKGLEQTARYMDGCAADAGHLVIFNRSQRRWKDKVFHRSESVNGTPIEVWGI